MPLVVDHINFVFVYSPRQFNLTLKYLDTFYIHVYIHIHDIQIKHAAIDALYI